MSVRVEHIHLTGCIGDSGLGFDLVLNGDLVRTVMTTGGGCAERNIPEDSTIWTDLYFTGEAIRRLVTQMARGAEGPDGQGGNWAVAFLGRIEQNFAFVKQLKEASIILQFTLNPDLDCDCGDAICFEDHNGNWVCVD